MDSRRIDTLWSHVHWLAVLGELGSYTAAAERMSVSKAAMSQRISELERAAGVPLVQRTTRSVRLTEAGQQLADATRGAFETIERGFASVRDLASAPRGLLRVTAPVAFGRQQIVPCLPEFLRAYPEVRLELDLSDRLVPLAQEGFDLAIRHTARPPETHVAWALTATRALLVAAPPYLQQRGTPQHPDELAQHDCLSYPRPGEPAAWSFTLAQPVGAPEQRQISVTVAARGPLSANNSEALREAALAGLGIALLPDFSARQAVQAGLLIEVLPQWMPTGAFGDQIYAIRPYSPYVPRAVHALVSHLRRVLPQTTAP
ncbi:MAG: LysR family transcriptional regulator [Leptothrix sp. (in: b-proteobacteria)]